MKCKNSKVSLFFQDRNWWWTDWLKKTYFVWNDVTFKVWTKNLSCKNCFSIYSTLSKTSWNISFFQFESDPFETWTTLSLPQRYGWPPSLCSLPKILVTDCNLKLLKYNFHFGALPFWSFAVNDLLDFWGEEMKWWCYISHKTFFINRFRQVKLQEKKHLVNSESFFWWH